MGSLCFRFVLFAIVVAHSVSAFSADGASAVPHLPIAHSLEVTAAGRLPNSDLIVTAAADGRVKTWEETSGHLIGEYTTADGSPVAGMAIDPVHPGRVAIAALVDTLGPTAIVGGSADIRLVDLSSNSVVRSFPGQAGRLAFSPQGRWLVSGAYSLLSIWEVETGILQATIQMQDGSGGGTFADENTLAFRRNGAIVFLDLLSGYSRSLATGADGSFALSPDGLLLAEIAVDEIRIRNVSSGELLASRYLMNTPRTVFFMADGSVVAGDYMGSIFDAMNLVYRLKGGDWTLETFTAGLSPLTLIADGGGSVILGQLDGRVQRLDFEARVMLQDLGKTAGDVSALGFSLDGRYLAAGLSNGGVAMWEPTSNWYRVFDPQGTLPTPPEPSFSDVDTQRSITATYVVGQGRTNSPGFDRERVVGLAFLGPERLLVAHRSGKAEVLDVATGRVVKSFVVESPRTVIRARRSAMIVGYHSATAVKAETFETRMVDLDVSGFGAIAVALDEEGRRLGIKGFDGIVEVDVETGNVLERSSTKEGMPLYRKEGPLAYLTWSVPVGSEPPAGAGGTYEISDWSVDHEIGVLSQPTGRTRIWVRGGLTATEFQIGGSVSAVAVAPDGNTVAIGSGNGRIAIRRTTDGAPLVELATYDRRGWLAMSPEGYFDGSYATWTSVGGALPGNLRNVATSEGLFNRWYRPQLLAAALKGASVEPDYWPSPSSPGHPPAVRIISPSPSYERETAPPMSTKSSLASDMRTDEQGKPVSWTVIAPNSENSQIVGMKRLHDQTVVLEAEATDGGEGLEECRVFRNRRLVASLHPQPNAGKHARYSVKVPISVGDNVLGTYCFSSLGTRSEEAEVHVFGGEELQRKRTAYVLAVGIDSYSDGYALRYAKADAALALEKLQSSLEATRSYDAVVPILLADAEATSTAILGAVRILSGIDSPQAEGPLTGLDASTPSDVVFIFFAGHGGGFAGDYRLIAVDGRVGSGEVAGTVSAGELRDNLAPLLADRVVLIIDACEAGQALDQVDGRAGPLAGRSLAQMAYDKAMFVISASQSRQSALELKRLGHGLFSYVLFESGFGSSPDENKDGFVSIREWLEYAQTETPREQERESAARGRKGTRSTFLDEHLNSVQTPRVFIPDPSLAREFIIHQVSGSAK
ncbi:caspase family protein [Rhizobium sp. Leaf383]|uniref:caspase family protein n=1 Tax=Rhizobium sp. Leaf383 TaxID=1736357 RepID=UPI000714833C|nr:caspase family protein [Rhizobium sp. Leaf383]KQS75966.1 hypothetical protein ASG58_14160 [Rhizobium sp. Leaf383]